MSLPIRIPGLKMTDKFQQLVKQYPRLFPDPEAWAIECYYEGWYQIIADALFLIDQEIEYMPQDISGGIKVSQIKSKFGGLRLYLSETTPFLRGVVAMAEQASYSICEHCGNSGSARTIPSAWRSTLCDEHYTAA